MEEREESLDCKQLWESLGVRGGQLETVWVVACPFPMVLQFRFPIKPQRKVESWEKFRLLKKTTPQQRE